MFPKRKPLHAALREMIDLAELEWPVTYMYEVSAPWGLTRQELTVNVPALVDNFAATERLGLALWSLVTAPAVSGFVALQGLSWVPWRFGAAAPPSPTLPRFGDRIAVPASRDNSPQLVFLTGHGDKASRRRFFLPGAPREWVSEGLLTREGFEQLLPHASGMMLGLATPELGSGIEWLLVYPGEVQGNPDNPTGTCFRRVKHVRVCWHVDRAPDVPGA